MNTYCITLLPDLTSTAAEFSQSSESRESSSTNTTLRSFFNGTGMAKTLRELAFQNASPI